MILYGARKPCWKCRYIIDVSDTSKARIEWTCVNCGAVTVLNLVKEKE